MISDIRWPSSNCLLSSAASHQHPEQLSLPYIFPPVLFWLTRHSEVWHAAKCLSPISSYMDKQHSLLILSLLCHISFSSLPYSCLSGEYQLYTLTLITFYQNKTSNTSGNSLDITYHFFHSAATTLTAFSLFQMSHKWANPWCTPSLPESSGAPSATLTLVFFFQHTVPLPSMPVSLKLCLCKVCLISFLGSLSKAFSISTNTVQLPFLLTSLQVNYFCSLSHTDTLPTG